MRDVVAKLKFFSSIFVKLKVFLNTVITNVVSRDGANPHFSVIISHLKDAFLDLKIELGYRLFLLTRRRQSLVIPKRICHKRKHPMEGFNIYVNVIVFYYYLRIL